jgi:hypothetical protein
LPYPESVAAGAIFSFRGAALWACRKLASIGAQWNWIEDGVGNENERKLGCQSGGAATENIRISFSLPEN